MKAANSNTQQPFKILHFHTHFPGVSSLYLFFCSSLKTAQKNSSRLITSLSFFFFFFSFKRRNQRAMQLLVSSSLRHVTVFPGKGVREFIKVRVGSRWVSYRMLFYCLLFFTFLVRFIFVFSTVDTIDGDLSKCSTLGILLSLH